MRPKCNTRYSTAGCGHPEAPRARTMRVMTTRGGAGQRLEGFGNLALSVCDTVAIHGARRAYVECTTCMAQHGNVMCKIGWLGGGRCFGYLLVEVPQIRTGLKLGGRTVVRFCLCLLLFSYRLLCNGVCAFTPCASETWPTDPRRNWGGSRLYRHCQP